MKPQDSTKKSGQNQGEGDKASARRYNEHASQFARSGQVESAAKDAESFVDEHPAEAKADEAKAKGGPRTKLSVDELVAKGQTVVARVKHAAERVVKRIEQRRAAKKN